MGSADGDQAMQVSTSRREEERILVSVRLRPLNLKEASRKDPVDWECINDTTIIYNNNFSPERSLHPNSFTFDRVFRSNCSTRQVYEEGAKAVVLSVVSGINSSVFAYGQTSSGKTFTMSGITEYTMQDIYDYIHKHKERDFHLKFSAMEIYNESVRDLLKADSSPLRLLDDPERGTVVDKLTEESLRDWDHFKELITMCEAQRQIGETFLNEASSRSHQILRLTIESSNHEFLGKNNCSTLAATLNFVDLAGSERASQALSAGTRLKEGSHINRSLLTLGTVIRKLSKGQNAHIPYRDSKLTRILQSSLGGNARTAVICTMSPARSYVEQSRNTLLFASCAKEVTTDACVNVVMSDKALMKHLQRELARLESELRNASPSTRTDASDLLREKEFKIDELERRVKELTLQLDLALSQICNLQQIGEQRLVEEDSSYSMFHVRQASESSCSGTATVVDHHSLSAHYLTLDPSESPDKHSRLSYDENSSVSDIEENLPRSCPFESVIIGTCADSSPALHMQTPIFIENDHPQLPNRFGGQRPYLPEAGQYTTSEETGGQTPKSIERDLYHVTEEIEEETSDTFELCLPRVYDGYGCHSHDFVEFDPYQVSEEFGEKRPNSYDIDEYHASEGIGITQAISNYDDIDPQQSPEVGREQIDNTLEKYCKEVQCIEYENLPDNLWPPVEERNSLFLMGCENDRCTQDELKENSELDKVNSSLLQDRNEPCGIQPVDVLTEFENSNCVESNSQTNDMSIACSSAAPEEVEYEIKYECGNGECIVRLEDVHGNISALNNDADTEFPEISIGYMALDETTPSEVKASNHMDDTESHTSLSANMEITKAMSMDQAQLKYFQVEDTLKKAISPIKNMKDVGLNAQDDLHEDSPCPADANSLQRQIIGLWDACNILLVHRTYFFLLFVKGDQEYTIYMEVERRRLSYIKDAFSWGNSIVLDGHQLTPGSSARYLHSEREMLSKLMKRRFSSQERMDLYERWGISLNSKRRSSQLAHRLWVNTIDMDHVKESAKIVARLVRLSEPQVPKEVFGLNLKTTQGRKKSFRSKILALPCKKTFLEASR